MVIAKNEFIKDHADRVDAFMDAYKESVDFVNSDTEAAAQIIGDHDIIPKRGCTEGNSGLQYCIH